MDIYFQSFVDDKTLIDLMGSLGFEKNEFLVN